MQTCVIVGKIGVECVCTYCRKVFRNPISFRHCKHVFCAECAERIMSSTQRCHLCAIRVVANDITECKYSIYLILIICRPHGRVEGGQ